MPPRPGARPRTGDRYRAVRRKGGKVLKHLPRKGGKVLKNPTPEGGKVLKKSSGKGPYVLRTDSGRPCPSYHQDWHRAAAAQLTTLRAAWASKLKVSSTRPTPPAGSNRSPRAASWAACDSHKGFVLRHCDGPFEQQPIHLGGDHPFAKFLQRALRQRRLLGTQAPQDHLHPETSSNNSCRCSRRNPRSFRTRPRRFKMNCSCLVGATGCPTRDDHLHTSSGRWPASASDHTPRPQSIPRWQLIDFRSPLNRSAF